MKPLCHNEEDSPVRKSKEEEDRKMWKRGSGIVLSSRDTNKKL